MRKPLMERIGKERLFFDGGSGTILQARGLKPGEHPDLWNLSHPEEVIALNRAYYEAGSHIVNTNTFGTSRFHFPDQVEEIVFAAVANATKARELAGREEDAYVALDIGPSGKLLEPMGDLAFEDAVEAFAEVVRAGAKAGADLVMIETMNDTLEAKAAVLAAKENCDLPVFLTMTFDESGQLLTGGSCECAAVMMEGLGVDGFGLNCSLGPRQMANIAKRLSEIVTVPLLVNPNAGLPRTNRLGQTVFDVGPEEFASGMREIADYGASALGGCCGTTPDHIRVLIDSLKDVPFQPCRSKKRTLVSGTSVIQEIGDIPKVIGERINPTGKKRLQQALREEDYSYILSQAIAQEEAGADILDVNVGLPGIDEPRIMRTSVLRLQGVTSLPLQLDSSDPEALEAGMRIYNGKPMINSVSAKEETIRAVMPLVKKYGGVLVGLCLDEEGIPETADGRLRCAEKIYKAAEDYGLSKEDIVIDGLAMTVSSSPDSAKITLETIRRIHDEYHGNTILGVSNISFGLPMRERINAAFFAMALQSGLSAAIINPNNEMMMNSFRSSLALLEKDENFANYIQSCSNDQPSAVPVKSETVFSLKEAVERGMKEAASQAAKKELSEKEPLEVINTCIVPALDAVGQGFEKKTIYLPQLLMAAEAAKAAFEEVREKMSGTVRETRGRMILATVKGDIHDIGKNIVKVMLENYGYEVLDLGRNVDPEVIADTAVKEGIRLVGLSALMTTTVKAMEETIVLLRKTCPDTKIVVGGAVLTKEYAEKIGADRYAKDAMETVRYADEVFGGNA